MKTAIHQTLDTISCSNRYHLWVYNTVRPYIYGDVLDVGSGMGTVVEFFARCPVRRVIVSDCADEMVDVLLKRFSEKENYAVRKLNITDDACFDVVPRHSMDAITNINVLEHIENDNKALRHMSGMLRARGRLILLVPALPSLYGTLDALVQHCRRYTRATLNPLLKENGFIVEKQHYMNMLGTVTWFVAGRVLKLGRFDPHSCGMLDAVVPLLEKIEDVIRPPFGQALVTVCRKA